MDTTIQNAIRNYVSDTFGVPVEIERWPGESALMPVLRREYGFLLARIRGTLCLVMHSKDGLERSPARLVRQMQLVAQKTEGALPLFFACRTISPTNRLRYVKAGIPFIVPGRHAHLPFLGLSASEARGFGAGRLPGAFDTAVQLVYLAACDGFDGGPMATGRIAGAIGRSKMSVSRAFRTISGLGLGQILQAGREHAILLYGRDRVEAFRHGLPYLRDPVAERYIAYDDGLPMQALLPSGESALAAVSMLAEPARPVFAMGRAEWRALMSEHRPKLAPVHDADTVEIEVWRYPPGFMSGGVSVDMFSLCLSLRGSGDARVEEALEVLLESMRIARPADSGQGSDHA
ncbi:MAG: hypothetical protein J5863_00560 [Desulfovibrio sp.]|nr:hypothetical protein [Desulfovibrio sp.]